MTVKPSLSERFSDFYVRHEYAVVLFFILVWQAFLFHASDGRLIEPDNYTHALRLLDFIQSGSWAEILYRHDNCPYGQMLHFTRLTDMFLYVVTLPFLPFTDVKSAIIRGCFLYNPVMACLTAAALIWGGRSFFTPLLRALSVALYFTATTAVMFIAGRPDHHVLLNLLLILLIGCFLHGVKTQKTAYFKAAGIYAGLSVWATPEGFLAGILFLAGLTTAWLTRYQNVRQIRFFCQYFFVSTVASLIANPPIQGLFYPDNGRLSVVMVAVTGFAFLSFRAEEILERKKYIRSFTGRFLSLLLLTSVSLGTAVLIFGTKALFSSPIPDELYDIWTSKIMELQPAYTGDFSIPIVSIPIDSCCIGIIAFFLASARNRKILLTLGFPLFFLTALTMMVLRFGRVEIAFAVFILPLSVRIFSENLLFSAATSSKLKKLSAFLLPVAFMIGAEESYTIQKQWTKANDIRDVLPYLPQKNGCLLSDNNRGPELAWRTGKAVIGTHYHSNAQGIIDNHAIFSEKKQKKVAALLKKREIDTILIEKIALDNQIKNRSFIMQMYSDSVNACFVRPVAGLTPELKKKYFFYEVDFTACDRPGK